MEPKPDLTKAAVCGLFCPSCTVYIATHEEPERLTRLATLMHKTEDEIRCDGCRSDRRTAYCGTCVMVRCAMEKGVEFCGACPEYPCEELKKFQAAMPHRIELWEMQQRICEAGWKAWFAEQHKHYSCPDCGVINSAYDLKCRKCGADPGSEYAAQHADRIREGMKKIGMDLT